MGGGGGGGGVGGGGGGGRGVYTQALIWVLYASNIRMHPLLQ